MSCTEPAKAGPPRSRRRSGGPIPAASADRGPASRSASWARTVRPRPTGETGLVYIRPPGASAVLLPQRRCGHRRRLAGRRLHRRRHRPPRRGRLPHHHRPGLGHGAVGRRQHRPPRDRGGPLRAPRGGRLRRLRHPRRARRRAPEGHRAAPPAASRSASWRPTSSRGWPPTRSPTCGRWSTSCPGTRTERSSSGCSARPTVPRAEPPCAIGAR